ncbi:MAG: hypothetical protein FJ100_06680 [Deltaproteobacteria bacterium]|nr:hypothetical protein [Deltaproteobacteria bacterium]
MASPRVSLTLGVRDVSVAVGQAVVVEPEEELRLARATVRCAGCGTSRETVAPPVFDTHDDDHFGRLELWYTTTHRARCGCGRDIEVVLGHTETRNLLTGGRSVACDGVRSARGGALA